MPALDIVDVLLSSGFAATIIGTFIKWRHDKKKAPLEREQILSAASTENINSSVAISGEYRQLLEITKQSFQAEIERINERNQCALKDMEARHTRALEAMQERLTRIENRNVELTVEVASLRQSESDKDHPLANQEGRITRLERKLHSARQTVQDLLAYIKAHGATTQEMPVVDLSIFDLK